MRFCPECDCYTYKQDRKTKKRHCTLCGHNSDKTKGRKPDISAYWKEKNDEVHSSD